MRLREDACSYRAIGLKKKLELLPDAPRLHSKKDTKRWCKGVVGRTHDYELSIPPHESKTIAGFRKIPICNNCDRQDYRGVVYRQKDGSYSEHWSLLDDEEA